MTIAISGHVAPGLERVAEAFRAGFDDRPSMGAALHVRRDGETVLDLWAGIADERTGQAWTATTPSVIFSCTKGLMSILAAQLVEAGRLDYDAPVSSYWPEFAAASKGSVTVRHLLAHKAGLSAPRQDLSLEDMLDWTKVTSLLAAQEPLWPLGQGYAYHAITHGWLIGEVIRRITGKPVGQVFAEAIASPLGVDAWVGLPASEMNRPAHLQVAPGLAQLWVDEAAKPAPNWPYRAMTLGGALPPSLVTADGGFNDPQVQAAEIPGAGGIATAAALATIWSATVVPTKGVRLIGDAIMARATQTETEGAPVFEAQPPFPRWGMGLQLDSEARRFIGEGSFGHDGAGGQVGFADPRHRIGFGYVTNWMEGAGDLRATAILDALRQIVT
ncbi:serine hydrolase domain-containing protein [Devosia sp.]|uniref:serine hydrolase domain-containing protein n=1 Tax=Devosia sp. TaxID=1871048 RepID=UPI003BAAE6BF